MVRMKHFSIVKGNSKLKCQLIAETICFKQKVFCKGDSKLKMLLRYKHFLNSKKIRFSRKNIMWKSLSYL